MCALVSASAACACVCVCVCVWMCASERASEGERERVRVFQIIDMNALNMYLPPTEKGYGLISIK